MAITGRQMLDVLFITRCIVKERIIEPGFSFSIRDRKHFEMSRSIIQILEYIRKHNVAAFSVK